MRYASNALLDAAARAGNLCCENQKFNKYVKLDGGCMAPEVIFRVDGKTVTSQQYSDLRANVDLDSKLFDPQCWRTVHWKE